MPGIAGQWFKPFALTIACAVLVSLFVSFSLDPMLSAYWPDPQLEAHERRNADRARARAIQRLVRPPGRPLQGVDRVGARSSLADGGHRRGVVRRARSRSRSRIGGFGFVPVSDQQRAQHRDRDAAGLEPRLHDAQGRGDRADDRATHPEVAYTYTTVGSSDRLGRGGQRARSTCGSCRRTSARISQDALGAACCATRCARVGGATAYTFASADSAARRSSCSSSCRVRTRPCSTQLAEQIATIGARRRRARWTSGCRRAGRSPSSTCEVNRGLAGTLGVSLASSRSRCASRSPASTRARGSIPTGISRYVHVRLAPEARENAADLGQLPVIVDAGAGAPRRHGAAAPPFVPLGQVATITPSSGPAQIDHYQRAARGDDRRERRRRVARQRVAAT